MIVRRLQEITGSEREVRAENGNWVSRRFVLDDDQAGFSFHETTIHAGTETHIWYQNHIEAVYCVDGEGEIEELANGKIHPISNGTMYLLNEHDEHLLRATSDLRLICVFNPPLCGRETHDENGVYAAHPRHEEFEAARLGQQPAKDQG